MKKLIVVGLVVLSTSGYSGDESAHGGDAYASEFIATANHLVELAKMVPPEEIAPLTVTGLAEAVAATKVSSREKVDLEGEEVDAINYPEKKEIKLNRSRWRGLREDSQQSARMGLVLHEYLSIMRIEDSRYANSLKLVKVLGMPTKSKIGSQEVVLAPESSPDFGIALSSGAGIFTGALGKTNTAALYFGGRLSYLASRFLAFELSYHRGDSIDSLGSGNKIDTTMSPVLLGTRFMLSSGDSKSWQPYFGIGGGLYLRRQTVVTWASSGLYQMGQTATSKDWGGYVAVGNTFKVSGGMNVGADIRYHKIFGYDRGSIITEENLEFGRTGDYVTPTVSLEVVL